MFQKLHDEIFKVSIACPAIADSQILSVKGKNIPILPQNKEIVDKLSKYKDKYTFAPFLSLG